MPGPAPGDQPVVGVAAVAGQQRPAAPQPADHGEGHLGGGQGHQGEGGDARPASVRRVPRPAATSTARAVPEQVGAAVAQVDPGRGPVVDQEADQGGGQGHGRADGPAPRRSTAKPTAATATVPPASMSSPSMRLTPLTRRTVTAIRADGGHAPGSGPGR